MREQERSLRSVPKTVFGLLIISLCCQIVWHQQLPPPSLEIQALASPPPATLLRLSSLGDSIVTAKILMLWIQAFDNQKGQFLTYSQLDYLALQQWLAEILSLDPGGQYPLLAASHLYSAVPDPVKQQQMLEFVYQQFFVDPARRWPWLTHAVIVAKHRLRNLPLALKYAQALATHTNPQMPRWAQEMQIFILEEMGEWQHAQVVIDEMLTSGQMIDPEDIEFLTQERNRLRNGSIEKNLK
ncbi:MAG: hypothetical protein BWK79_07115 [Beggiatoa sp. IS2]|nr:MAG: hypothetical protein BWK79_07115 [Beggiatoa sp. IS2]